MEHSQACSVQGKEEHCQQEPLSSSGTRLTARAETSSSWLPAFFLSECSFHTNSLVLGK